MARLGGDEFGVLLPGADGAQAIRVAEAILAAVRKPVAVKGHAVDVGASIGIALCPDHTREPVALMQFADLAMYAAKRAKIGFLMYAPSYPNSHPTARL